MPGHTHDPEAPRWWLGIVRLGSLRLTVAAVGCKTPTSPYVSRSLLPLPLTAAKRRGWRDFAASLSHVPWLTAALSFDHLL